DRVDDRLPLAALEGLLEDARVGGVEHERDLNFSRQHLQEGDHVGQLFAVGVGEADVEHLRAAAHLAPPDLGRLVEVTADHQLLELAAADDVRALADHHRAAIVLDGEDLDAGDDGAPDGGRAPWPVAPRHLGDHADVFGRRAAAAADDVDPALGAEALELCDHHLGRLVVMPSSSGRPAFGKQETGKRESWASVRRWSVMKSGPVAQLSPIARSSRWATET